MMKLVFATNNQHKIDELRQIVGSSIEIVGLRDIGCTDDIPEDGATLEENARIKARYVNQRYGVDCFADDTGLEVDALGGAPGVYSARYAGGAGHDTQANMDLLLRNMEGCDDRRARFRTVICLIIDDQEHQFEGIVEGQILRQPQGTAGFGYDPVFQPQGWDKTFAQATAQEKNAVSHRGRATEKLVAYLQSK